MQPSSPPSASNRFYWLVPCFHILGAALVVVLTGLFSAVNSPLGQEISAGESPGFAWIRSHIVTFFAFALIYLIMSCWLQIVNLRRFSTNAWLALMVCIELICIALIAILLFLQYTELLPLILTILLIALLLQALFGRGQSDLFESDPQSGLSGNCPADIGLFLIILFVIGAAIACFDPSWRRLSDQVILDSNWEYALRYLFPPALFGVTAVWFGIGMVFIISGFRHMQSRASDRPGACQVFAFLTFFSLVAVFAVFLLITLYYAIAWQISNLNLKYTVWQLIIFLSLAGGILFSAAFRRLCSHIPRVQERSLVGLVAFSMAAAFLFPLIWVLSSRNSKKHHWSALYIFVFSVCVIIGYLILFGGIFNPWFTALSYLKGALLIVVSVVAAGTGVLIIQQLFSIPSRTRIFSRRSAAILIFTALLGFLPYYMLGAYPEVKAAVLQYNELARVNATFVRDAIHTVGLGRWLRLGQRPPDNHSDHPWPQPWQLNKTRPSLLPKNFNLVVLVVDALRGDAFHSAGYHRNLTPFLDQWALEEGLSFRHAYSQGGGSFAAYPFLVAGRSRFDLYGPDLYQQNLYFKIAQAEGFQHYMLMKGFGPRNIYPPDLAVTELRIPRAISDRRSATADEVFKSARKAIGQLPADERFLCFLTLMDVHNDLYKKAGGIDFGDSPRDLYDNNLSYLDRVFSRFIAWLKKEGIYDRTVIIFTSDHGEQFWEHGASLHGHTVYEEEIRIPLILVSHAIKKRIDDVPVIAADMAPTIAELAGYSVDPPYDDSHMGISLLPLVINNDRKRYLHRDVVGRASFKRRYFIYRDWEWKLIYFAELDVLQLFNLKDDPSEKINLLAEEAGLAGELEHQLFEYLKVVEGKTYHSIFSEP